MADGNNAAVTIRAVPPTQRHPSGLILVVRNKKQNYHRLSAQNAHTNFKTQQT